MRDWCLSEQRKHWQPGSLLELHPSLSPPPPPDPVCDLVSCGPKNLPDHLCLEGLSPPPRVPKAHIPRQRLSVPRKHSQPNQMKGYHFHLIPLCLNTKLLKLLCLFPLPAKGLRPSHHSGPSGLLIPLASLLLSAPYLSLWNLCVPSLPPPLVTGLS